MSEAGPLDLVGIGAMVVDRVHRAERIVGPDEKGRLRPVAGGAAVQRFAGGVVLNQLGWASALGLRTGIFGRQADDEPGRWLRRTMQAAGIEQHLVLDAPASSVAEIFVDARGERAIYFDAAATGTTDPEHLRRHHAAFLARGARLTTEIHMLPLPAVREALRMAREAGLETAVDLDMPPRDAVPALGDEATLLDILAHADLLKASRRAAQELGDATDPVTLAVRLRERFGGRAVVVTDGDRGCAVAAEGCEQSFPAYKVEAVDCTGAGDAFLGGLLAGLHQGLGWHDAARLANACGAACVEQLGAFPADGARARERALQLYDGSPFAPRAAVGWALDAGAGAHAALAVAVRELDALRERLDAASYGRAIALIRDAETAGARVHVTGVGKPEHVARYGASLLSSTGTPATFLHATETVHGSAGQVVSGDVVIAISNSGATGDLLAAVSAVRNLGARIVAVTGAPDSPLARAAEVTLDAAVALEGGGLGLAPRASAAAELLVLAALSAGLEEARGLTREEYHARHPAGRLGALSGEE